MNKEKFISAVIPAYNEQDTIASVVKEIIKIKEILEVIVVNDGSTDQTGQNAGEAGAKVINHPYNIGNGAAVKTGIRNASGGYVLLLDADLQHPPAEIDKMTRYIDDYDMVVGARTSKSAVSKFRSAGNYVLIKIAEYLTEQKIMDLTSGFRIIDREKCLQFLHLFPNKYSYPTTITLCFFHYAYTVKYVPLLNITKRKYGQSRIRPFQDGLRFILIILKVIVLFNPLKIFLPVSVILLLLGFIQMYYTLFIQNAGIRSGSIITILGSIIIFCFGLLSQQISDINKN